MLKLAKKGFTLVELMVVVVIIAILAVIAIPQFIEYSDRNKLINDKRLEQSINLNEIEKSENDI